MQFSRNFSFQNKIKTFFPEEAKTKNTKSFAIFKNMFSLKVNYSGNIKRRKTCLVFCGNDRENLHGRTNFQQNISTFLYNNNSWEKKSKTKICDYLLVKRPGLFMRGGGGGLREIILRNIWGRRGCK
jgi:hypothetical protein